jgi:hypothetical protein
MRRLLALMLSGLTLLIAIAATLVGLQSLPGGDAVNIGFFLFLFIGLGLYWGLGALIVVRGHGHVIGWLFVIGATLMATVFACYAIDLLLPSSPTPHPMVGWLWLAGSLLFAPAIILILPAVALTFPTGALPGPGWRWPVRFVAAMVFVWMLIKVIRPGPMGDGLPENPLTPLLPAFSPSGLEILGVLQTVSGLSIVPAAGLGVAAILVRFRRSHGDERQQLKWFLAAMVPAAVLLPLSLSELGTHIPLIGLLSVATLPVVGMSVAVAILRYRLYDIDRIISRTIAYAIVSGILAIVFGAMIVFLSAALSTFAQGQTIAVAASTLVAIAVFQPLLRRVRVEVDRRFDRTHYDAERTVAKFADRLRDEVDLANLSSDLDATIREAVAPRSLGIWIRRPRPTGP